MPAATSLVELILKKWGDDIAGAAKELEEKVGFPESVANRIASGELPMDEASRLKRAQEQGYGDELYHGSTHNILEFNGRGNPQNDWGEGTYLSDSTHDISRNYSGTQGADFQSRWFEEKERLEADYDMGKRPDLDDGDGSFDDWKAREEAINKFKGENDGVIYPVRVKQEGLFNISDEIPRPDYMEMAQEEMGIPGKNWVDMTQEESDRVWELADEFQADDPNSTAMSLFEMGQEYDVRPEDIPHPDDVVSWNGLRHELREVYGEDELGNSVTSGTLVGDVMRRQGGKGVVDTTTPDRFDSMEAGNHTIIFPGNENQIRSVNAAFDPEYTGSNIMGNATVPMLGATAGLSGGGLLAASLTAPQVKDSGMISAPRSDGLFNFTMGARDLERRLEGSPASLLFPSGLVDYLETVNRRTEDPNAMTRGMALLDFF